MLGLVVPDFELNWTEHSCQLPHPAADLARSFGRLGSKMTTRSHWPEPVLELEPELVLALVLVPELGLALVKPVSPPGGPRRLGR